MKIKDICFYSRRPSLDPGADLERRPGRHSMRLEPPRLAAASTSVERRIPSAFVFTGTVCGSAGECV
jgi:hypothetical protein